MSATQRGGLGAGSLVATLLLFIVIQSATQEAETQPEDATGTPTYQEGTQQAAASGEIIVKLADDASQADLRDLAASTRYTVMVKGGAGGVKDKAGNPLAANKVWYFKTGA